MILLLRLFWEFFQTGLFSIGGGLATLPFLADMADRTGWFTRGELADMVAVAESTPGPIGINTATYVGHTTAGIPGSIVATLGIITPSIIVILIIAGILNRFQDNKYVKSIFYFIRPASLALVSSAGISFGALALFYDGIPLSPDTFTEALNIRALILALVIFSLTQFVPVIKKLHPVCFIGLSAVVGILVF